MSASPRLLYILPDMAYVAELLPAKQPTSFAIHSFRQINGTFITEEEFLAENLEKLLDKLEPGEYQVVLPDFLFTDTILNVKATSEAQVKAYIKDQLLPSLEIDKTSHYIETFVLTEHRGVYKLQLSALEKSLVAPLAEGMAERALHIKSVVAVSWALKSVISLEPALSIVQLGEYLYLAEQYIGVDQALSVPVSEAENLIDTVKTLKGAEPSIQTIYLLSSELVAEKLRQGLHDTVPLQQLAVFNESDDKMPSYLKLALEVSMKTLSTPEYQLPAFMPEVDTARKTAKIVSAVVLPEEPEVEKIPDLPAIMSELPEADEMEPDEIEADETKSEPDDLALPTPEASKVTVSFTSTASSMPKNLVDLTDTPASPIKKPPVIDLTTAQPAKVTVVAPKPVVAVEALQSPAPARAPQVVAPAVVTKKVAPAGVIKNKSDVNGVMKLIGIGVGSFIVTVGIGVGLGLGLVMFTNKQTAANPFTSFFKQATPTPAPTTTPVATPTATPAAKLDPAAEKLLVVNATTIPGHAGKVASSLTKGGFTQVKTGNAQGKYEKGAYVLTKSTNPALVESIKTMTGLTTLQVQTTTTTEDPKGDYSAIIVLAE